jgi:hypothetical protein
MTVRNVLPAGCAGFRQADRISRREALRVGGLLGFGLTLPTLLRQEAAAGAPRHDAASRTFGRARRVISLFLHGGHPQQETFDPKPDGPAAVRGEFGAIETSVPGVRFCELLPQTARLMHRLSVVRSMSHSNPNHVTACLPAQTGHAHPPGTPQTDFPPAATDFPPFGAVLDWLRESGGAWTTSRPLAERVDDVGASLPTWVRVGPLMRRNNGTVLHGQLPGFLGSRHMHFAVDQPLLDRDVQIEAVRPLEELTSFRLSARRDLLEQFDARRRGLEATAGTRDLDGYYQRAFNLIASAETRKAFDLAAESVKTREKYGPTEFGQRCLLARRLAEAGVPMTNVSYCHTPSGSWDTHSQNFKQMKNALGPTFDTAFAALMEDLAERGLLDDTLVLVNAEFGRTPQINKNAGRDHWPWVYSLVLAGAGIRPGTVYGASDGAAAYPTENPRDPRDMAATVYHLLGVAPDTVIYDAARRPHPLVIGRPIEAVLA